MMKRFLCTTSLMILLLITFGLIAAYAAFASSSGVQQYNYGIVQFPPNKQYAVYSGPGTGYVRANNGKAMVSTNDWIDVIGTDGDWVLIEYRLNQGGLRRGYIQKNLLPTSVREKVPAIIKQYLSGATKTKCSLTDDPAKSQRELALLSEGTNLLLLSVYTNDNSQTFWYVEVKLQTGTMRGYVLSSAVGEGASSNG